MSGTPTRFWKWGEKIMALNNILEGGNKMSLDVLDSNLKASSKKTSITDTANLLKSHFVIEIFLKAS